MKRTIITPKQQETLDFIKSFIASNKEAPTIVELARALGLKSYRSVTQRIESLEEKGFIKRDRFKNRGISIISDVSASLPGMINVPVISSAGCDAAQVYAQQQYGEFVTIDEKLSHGHKDMVAIKAVGNSMIDAGIRNGDYVLVEVTENVGNGDRVVALVGDMAVIKRLRIASNTWVLEPESKGNGYSPIIMSENTKIFGKVLNTIPMSDSGDDYQIIYDK